MILLNKKREQLWSPINTQNPKRTAYKSNFLIVLKLHFIIHLNKVEQTSLSQANKAEKAYFGISLGKLQQQ